MLSRRYYFTLPSPLSERGKAVLESRLRSINGIYSAYADRRNGVAVYYRGTLDKRSIAKAAGSLFTLRRKVNREKAENAPAFQEYRRDAIIALVGFVGMQVLKRVSPEIFASLSMVRSGFVLLTARNLLASGIKSLVKKGEPNADTLTATAVVASILAKKPESSLTLLALSNFAEMLTFYAAEKARKHISGLLKLDQQYVWLYGADGHEHKVSVESVKIGDVIAVHLGEKICVDGKVTGGCAAIDQSSITGESVPAIKSAGDDVYAGTVVRSGELLISVRKVGDDTSLARIIHMVENAQTRRAPVQNFADRMANMLVPISFLAAALVYGATRDWQRVLNMLFIDFSCGLKLSTATAISAAISKAAQHGMLVKGGNYIEALADIDTVILDKTGTITVGSPSVKAICTADGVSEKEAILLAASAELHSAHPLAAAIISYAEEQGWTVPDHEETETVVGRGMRALVADQDDFTGGEILLGSKRFMQEENISGIGDIIVQEYEEGSLVYLAKEGRLAAVFVIADPIRPDFKKAINQLRRSGIDEIIMLTGDTKKVAEGVAAALDIDNFHAEVLPEDKAELVARKQAKSRVMMIGDGVNDAPALAFADVGVAMGGKRTDIAVESADITINSDDPLKLPELLIIGRQTMKLVRQNFTATIAINTAAMLLGALGKINPLVAAVVHNAATIGVVINGARILLYGGGIPRK
jgi:cation-transporting P-type ATPase C